MSIYKILRFSRNTFRAQTQQTRLQTKKSPRIVSLRPTFRELYVQARFINEKL